MCLINFPPYETSTLPSDFIQSNPQSGVSVSLREIIDRFANKPDIMDLLLKAKIEEDRRLTEQYRCQVELAHEEMKQRELENLDQQRESDSPPVPEGDSFVDNLLSNLELDLDFLERAEPNLLDNAPVSQLKRKAAVDLCNTFLSLSGEEPAPRKVRVQHATKKKSPQQKFMQRIKL
ncbi:hypothetical protein K493DRAFT_320627 [Basidiobolus meristosporus CBS 931.73]|uniref:Uncharacterized protein n=1 Tax=Basidiobolus meristosporus CBS 931.73 TaxID=1314790 RepID=A0A1Y1X8A3_9FUNG|nr:hypothetical protein K493DRAFT_320627 [Basidiobolus meristosporus CBS 931.73]|eukprot:ORX81574.1 hypothetical protein K493DRAFT_320627 [Basidiobolus meristosporus CBS 931.73]